MKSKQKGIKMLENKYSLKYVGETFRTNQGYDAEVMAGSSKPNYVFVKINNDEVKEVPIQSLKKGITTYINHISLYSSEHVGKVFTTKDSLGSYQIECYAPSLRKNCIKIKVPLPDNIYDNNGNLITDTHYYDEAEVGDLKKGTYKNKYHPNIHGKGYVGRGKYSHKHYPVIYKTWTDMLTRCYDHKYHTKRPTYIGTTVDIRFLNFQFFAKWYESHYIDGYQMDKDLKQAGVKNKIYSPETICFIPQSLNSFIANVHSNNKSGYIGAHLDKESGKWKVQIWINGKCKYLGAFTSIKQAANTYIKARNKQVYKWYNHYIDLQETNQPLGGVDTDDILNLLMGEIPLEELIKDKDFDLSDYLDEDEEFQYLYGKWCHVPYETFKQMNMKQIYRNNKRTSIQ